MKKALKLAGDIIGYIVVCAIGAVAYSWFFTSCNNTLNSMKP